MPDRLIRKFPPRGLGQEPPLARWGHYGVPVLLFPPAAGDAEEAERNGMVEAVADLLASGRVKLYSVGAPATRARLTGTTTAAEREAVEDRFDRFLVEDVFPFIRDDCNSPEIEIVTAGPSLGARLAVATLVRHPDAVRAAIGMSGVYTEGDDPRDGSEGNDRWSLGDLPGAGRLEKLRTRLVVLAHGGGTWERPESSIGLARLLEGSGVPHRVEDWGAGWAHEWATWRAMLARYLEETA